MVGYTRALAAAVWVGTTDGKALVTKDGRTNVFGSTYAGPIWRQFMRAAHEAMQFDEGLRRFDKPVGPPTPTAEPTRRDATAEPTPDATRRRSRPRRRRRRGHHRTVPAPTTPPLPDGDAGRSRRGPCRRPAGRPEERDARWTGGPTRLARSAARRFGLAALVAAAGFAAARRARGRGPTRSLTTLDAAGHRAARAFGRDHRPWLSDSRC